MLFSRRILASTIAPAAVALLFATSSLALARGSSAATRCGQRVPGVAEISFELSRTVEASDHNTHFVGWSSNYESTQVQSLKSAGPGEFTVAYSHYGAKDPACCPKLKPVVVHYSWSGRMFISNGAPPRNSVKVVLGP